ncbi:MAG: hypothetical protein ACYCX6_00430 [Vulcanimicrobiaceae bacterium]
MKRDAVIRAAFYACQAVGQDTTIRPILAMVKRIEGKGIRYDLVRRWLKENRNRDSLGIRGGFEADSSGVLENANPDSPGIQPGFLRARAASVSKFKATSSEETNVSSSIVVTPSLQDSVTTPAEVFNFAGPVTENLKTRTPRQAKLPLNADKDIAARAVLDAAWAYLVDQVPDLALSRLQWRQRNKAVALDLVAQKKTPDDVVAMLEVAHEHPGAKFYRGLIMLAKLAERWHVLAQIASGESYDRRPEREYQIL